MIVDLFGKVVWEEVFIYTQKPTLSFSQQEPDMKYSFRFFQSHHVPQDNL